MNVSNYVSQETKAGKTYVIVTVGENAQVDKIGFNTMLRTKPSFIPPVTSSEINGEQRLSYDVTIGGFKQLNSLTMSSVEFLIFMKNLTDAIVNCSDYFLYPANFLINENLIYVNPENNDIRVIYMPFEDTVFTDDEINRQIFDLARALSRRFSANSVDEGWQEIIAFLWNLSENASVYEVNSIYTEMCNKKRNKSAAKSDNITPRTDKKEHNAEYAKPLDIPKMSTPTPHASIADKPKTSEEKLDSKKNWGLFNSNKKKDNKERKAKKPADNKPAAIQGGLFSGGGQVSPIVIKKEEAKPVKNPSKSGKSGFWSLNKKVKEKPEVHTGPVNSFNKLTDSDLTEMIDMSDATDLYDVRQASLYLIENGAKTTKISIPADKSNFVLGRNSNDVDYCFDGAGDKNISRVHAAIRFDGVNYFVVDTGTSGSGSSGGTYLHGQRLAPGVAEILKNGSVIKIGSRELLFELV